MPTCVCVTHGCYFSGGKDPISDKPLGRNVDGCTYKAHTVADRQAAFHAAEENTEAVLAAQIKEITAHLSASVLADNVSGPSLVPGGPLWSRNSSEDHQSDNDFPTLKQTGGPSSSPLSMTHHSPPSRSSSSSQSLPTSLHSPSRQTGSRRSPEAELIACLSELEQEVDTLRERALEGLARLGCPSSSGPPTSFPLSQLLQSSRSLKDKIETVMFKGPAVHDLKTLISSKLQEIPAKLVAAKKDWNQKLSDIKTMKTPIHEGVPCETGTVFKTNFQPFH
ncbi:hypothetical protein BYT27DRAFT_7101021 [Phlegmacium glaucopus]|nr:hypothetical protein BYT27DRAFT_7101021 [Phlegmacium glaucopus]